MIKRLHNSLIQYL